MTTIRLELELSSRDPIYIASFGFLVMQGKRKKKITNGHKIHSSRLGGFDVDVSLKGVGMP